MSDTPSEGSIIDLTPEEIKPVPVTPTPDAAKPAPTPATASPVAPSPEGPRVTFRGNGYDLAAFGSLMSGIMMLASCLTCNTIYYCLPLLPIVLGLVGVVSANQSVDARRTRTWSWIGVAAGVFILVVVLAAIVLYIAFVVLMIYLGEVD